MSKGDDVIILLTTAVAALVITMFLVAFSVALNSCYLIVNNATVSNSTLTFVARPSASCPDTVNITKLKVFIETNTVTMEVVVDINATATKPQSTVTVALPVATPENATVIVHPHIRTP